MFVHGDNLAQKEQHKTKYLDDQSRQFLGEIREQYDVWRTRNLELVGPSIEPDEKDSAIIAERVAMFEGYKDFIDQQHYAEAFDSRSALHSSVLEEFMYYLFRDLVSAYSENALIGKSHALKDLFFLSSNFQDMVSLPNAQVEKKDHDFVIGATIEAKMNVVGQDGVEDHRLDIPAVAIECKTYLDKTMLEGASQAAEQLKARNPNAIYFVVSEWLKLTEQVNLRKFKVDQIYVLRKQKNTDREFRYDPEYKKNPIHVDVVGHLYETVRAYLAVDWEGGLKYGLDRGYLL